MTTETTHDYASKGVAGTGLGLGIAGTALGLLNGGGLGILGGGCGWNRGWGYGYNGGCGPYGYGLDQCNQANNNHFITKDEFTMGQNLAAKDAEIALLKSENDSEKKMVDVYRTLESKINALGDKFYANREDMLGKLQDTYVNLDNKIVSNKSCQDIFNTQQVGVNATQSCQIACMQKQLNEISKYSVPWYDVTRPAFCPCSLSASAAVSAT